MVDSQTTSSIRFNNLSLLLKNMKSLKMTLETFSFRFNNVPCIIFVSHYVKNHENHKKHSTYIQNESTYFKAKLEFIDPLHCQNSCHPHPNNLNGGKGDNHGTIQCRTQTSHTKQTFIT